MQLLPTCGIRVLLHLTESTPPVGELAGQPMSGNTILHLRTVSAAFKDPCPLYYSPLVWCQEHLLSITKK